MRPLASEIARFVAALDAATLPPEVAEKARVCLLNAYGMGHDCHGTRYAPVARAAALALVSPRRSPTACPTCGA